MQTKRLGSDVPVRDEGQKRFLFAMAEGTYSSPLLFTISAAQADLEMRRFRERI